MPRNDPPPIETEVVPVSASAPEPDRIARAAAVLRAGGLVAFPTETVYGLGADAHNAEAVAEIFRAKGRPANNPLIVHVSTAEQARQVVSDWPEAAQRLAARFWPGPLTLVLPKRAELPANVTAGGPTVAVRVPAHPVALALLRAAGCPIAAPSANRSEQLSPTRADHVLRGLSGRVSLVLDGGPTPGGLESSVVDLTRSPPRLLRPGLVSFTELETVIGPLVRITGGPRESSVLPAPGMLRRHYAPRALLECVEGDAARNVEAVRCRGVRVGWLAFGPKANSSGVIVIGLPQDAAGYAARLYAALHELDDRGVEHIVAELPPDEPAWWAVRDRLLRAAQS